MENKDEKLFFANADKIDKETKKIKKRGFWCVIFPTILIALFTITVLILLLSSDGQYIENGNYFYYFTNLNLSTITIIIFVDCFCLLYLIIGLICFIKKTGPFLKKMKNALIKEEIRNEETKKE